MGKKKHSPLWDVAKSMPPLRHSIPGKPFDISESDAVQWLMRQPEIQQMVFNAVRNQGSIVYDPDTGAWQGIEHDD